MMASAGLLKLTMFIKRKPGLSEEEFHSYWTEKHPAVVNEWLAKHGVVSYVQVRNATARARALGKILS